MSTGSGGETLINVVLWLFGTSVAHHSPRQRILEAGLRLLSTMK